MTKRTETYIGYILLVAGAVTWWHNTGTLVPLIIVLILIGLAFIGLDDAKPIPAVIYAPPPQKDINCFYIEITGCTHSKAWYKNKIGQRFYVHKASEIGLIVDSDEAKNNFIFYEGENKYLYIDRKDCKVLKVDVFKP